MIQLSWLDHVGGSIVTAEEIINALPEWDVEIKTYHDEWIVTTGKREKHVIFRADNKEAVDAFSMAWPWPVLVFPPTTSAHVLHSDEYEKYPGSIALPKWQ